MASEGRKTDKKRATGDDRCGILLGALPGALRLDL